MIAMKCESKELTFVAHPIPEVAWTERACRRCVQIGHQCLSVFSDWKLFINWLTPLCTRPLEL